MLWVTPGQTLTDLGEEVREVLHEIWRRPIAIGSDYARHRSTVVAAAASLGLITTHIEGGEFGRQWRVTADGLRFLESA